MNKLFINLIGLILLIGCDYATPKIGSKTKPFIVYKITKYDSELSRYVSRNQGTETLTGSAYTSIILPTGYFNVGDTITFKKDINDSKSR